MFAVTRLFGNFLRSGRRPVQTRRKRHEATKRAIGSLETLEKRLAMTLDVSFQSPLGGGVENWVTVVLDEGSDAYMQVAATQDRSLLIADNSTFTELRSGAPVFSVPIEPVDAVFVYNGQSLTREAFDYEYFEYPDGNQTATVVVGDGLGLPDSYPAGVGKLWRPEQRGGWEITNPDDGRLVESVYFLLPSGLDLGANLLVPPGASTPYPSAWQTGTVLATLHAGGPKEATNQNEATAYIHGTAEPTDDPTKFNLKISHALAVGAEDDDYEAILHVPESSTNLQPYIEVRHAFTISNHDSIQEPRRLPINVYADKLEDETLPFQFKNRLKFIGANALPRLDIIFDSNTASPTLISDSIDRFRTVVGGVFGYGSSQKFDLYNESIHQYIPGTLHGKLGVDFAKFNQIDNINNLRATPLEFQVDSVSLDGDGLVNLSFVRNSVSPYGSVRTAQASVPFNSRDGSGNSITQNLLVAGTFDPASGVIELTTTLNGADQNFPVWLDEVSVALKRTSTDFVPPSRGINDPWKPYKYQEGPQWDANTFDQLPNDMTIYDGHDFTPSLLAELANWDSEISIESPITALGDGPLDGQVSVAATSVKVAAPVRADDAFRVRSGPGGMLDPTDTGLGSIFNVRSERLTVESVLSSPSVEIRLDVADDGEEAEGKLYAYGNPTTRTQLLVTQTGSISAANVQLPVEGLDTSPGDWADTLFVEAQNGDIFVEGVVAVTDQTYLISSGPDAEIEGPYHLTTRSRLTGFHTGRIVGGTVAVTLANNTMDPDAWDPVSEDAEFPTLGVLESVFDIRSSVERLRVQASDLPISFGANENGDFNGNDVQGFTNSGFPLPYAITVDEADGLIVDALAASSGDVDITAGGDLDLRGSVTSFGDVTLASVGAFSVNAPVATSFGVIEMQGTAVTVQNSVRVLDTVVSDERQTDIRITATDGVIELNDAVSAVNKVVFTAVGSAVDPETKVETPGSVHGSTRVSGNALKIHVVGDVRIGTDVNTVDITAGGSVEIDERGALAISVRGADAVSLTANGRDRLRQDDGEISPALYADLYGVDEVFVSAPNGSIDVRHISTGALEVGNGETIRATGESMVAAGTVVLNSTLAPEVRLKDAPVAVSGATEVRFATTKALPSQLGIPGRVSSFSPAQIAGVYKTDLNTTLSMDPITKAVAELGDIKATDIRVGDRILVKDGLSGYVDPLTGRPDVNIVNGVYVVTGVSFETEQLNNGQVSQWVNLAMTRSSAFDTSAELGGQERQYVRVTDGNGGRGSLAGQVFVSDGFRNVGFPASNHLHTPYSVSPINSSIGFQRVKAINTKFLENVIYDPALGTIVSAARQTAESVVAANRSITADAGVFGEVSLKKNDLVLIREPRALQTYQLSQNNGLYNGVYIVEQAGGPDEPWILRRWGGTDQDADGVLDGGQLGVFAIDDGPQRTSVTGVMYEVGHESVNRAPLEFKVLERRVSQLGNPYLGIEPDRYRTEIGTGRPAGTIVYEVSGEGGRNNEPGSLGKMLELVHQNVGVGSHNPGFEIHPDVKRIDLEQALPTIAKPLVIEPESELVIDGDEIVFTQTGGVVRSTRIGYLVGPTRPGLSLTPARLVRGDTPFLNSLDEIYGFEIATGGSGTVLRGISVGGFEQGAAVRITGAKNVLLEDMILGGDAAGNRMANEYGLRVEQVAEGDGGEFSTLLNSKIINSQRSLANNAGPEDGGSGVALGLNTTGVRIVGSVIGEADNLNLVGVSSDPSTGKHLIGVRRVLEAESVARLTVTKISDNKLTVAKSDYTQFGLREGTQFYDRSIDELWTIKEILFPSYNRNLIEVELELGPGGVQPLLKKTTGVSFGVESGYTVQFTANSQEIVLPEGFDADRLYLGQRVDAWPDNVVQSERDIALNVFESVIAAEVAMADGLVTAELATHSVIATIDRTGVFRFEDEQAAEWLASEVGDAGTPSRTISLYGAGLPEGLRVRSFDSETGRVEVEVVGIDDQGAEEVTAPPFIPVRAQAIHFGLGVFTVVDPMDIRVGDRIDGEEIFESAIIEAFGTPLDTHSNGGEAEAYLAMSAPEEGVVVGSLPDDMRFPPVRRFPEAGDAIQLVDLTGTRIVKIERVNVETEDEFGQPKIEIRTKIWLSQPIKVSVKAGILFPNEAERNVIGSNEYGIKLKSGSSKINSTDVNDSIRSGILVEGVGTNGSGNDGQHIIGGVVGVPRTTTGYGLSTENVSISGNGIIYNTAGIEFAVSLFDDLSDSQDIRDRANQITISGNVFGADITTQEARLGNGREPFRDIWVSAFPWLQAELVEDDTRLGGGRYKAKYRHEDNPLQDPKLRVFESFDQEGNFHFNGRPLWPEDDGDDWWNNMPTLG